MTTKTTKTRFPGVYTRESKKRRHMGKPDIVFYYCIHVKGKRVWYKAGWRSEGMTAQAAAGMRSKAIMLGRGQSLPAPSVAEMFNVAISLMTDFAPNTVRNYKQVFNAYILPALGKAPLDTITAADIRSLYDRVCSNGKAKSSAVLVINLFLAAWRKTLAAEKHTVPIPRGIHIPKQKESKHDRYLTKEEARKLILTLRILSPVWADMAELSLYTGARVGEIGSLTPACVHLDSRTAEVIGKTGHRSLCLSIPACEILKRNMAGLTPHEKIFPVSVGSHVAFNKVVDSLNLNPEGTPRAQRVVFHTLRHTFASWLAIDGVPLYTIKELMGHASIRMTERYAHLCPDLHRSAVDRISHFVSSLSDESEPAMP